MRNQLTGVGRFSLPGSLPCFDAHMHLNDKAFDECRDTVASYLTRSGYEGVCAGWDLPSSRDALLLTERWTGIHAAVGLHPAYLPERITGDLLDALSGLAQLEGAVAIGECGLDAACAVPDSVQRAALEAQLDLALALGMPAVLHVRGRHGDMIRLLEARNRLPACMLHGASLSREMARAYLEIGCMISIGGAVAWENSRRAKETAEIVPEDRLLLETDCPFQSPLRGEISRPESLFLIAEKAAEIRSMETDALLVHTADNARAFFGLPRGENHE